MDAAAVAVSFLAAFLLRFISGLIPAQDMPGFGIYSRALIVIIPVYLWFFNNLGLYDPHRHIRRIEKIFVVLKGVSYSIIVLMALTFFYRGLSYSRIYLIMLWLLSFLFVSTGRYLLMQWEYRRRRQMKEIQRVLVVGANRNARSVIHWAKNNRHYGQEIIGVLSRDPSFIGKHVEGVGILGVSQDCEAFIDTLKPDSVVLLDPSFSRDRITDLVVACEDRMIEFKVAADFYGIMTRRVDVEHISGVPLLGFKPLPLDSLWNRSLKRTFDIVISAGILFFSLPLWLAAAILIKCDDRGPVIYRQERVGRDGRVFALYKFRTMRVNAEGETGPVWARPNDSRRTRVGDFMRRWNIDELPQLWNVLKGDMSLVGPRPERPHFVKQFRETIPRYMARHKIKSGLTGWAQVNGLRGNTSIQERIKYDLYYMENWSLLLDIEILFMTFFAFKNAY